MAITHADISPSRQSTEMGSKVGNALMVSSILCALSIFIFCLVAESMRTEVTWVQSVGPGPEARAMCLYSGSGRTSFFCALASMVMLAIAMCIQHGYLAIAVTKSPSSASAAGAPPLLIWASYSPSTRSLRLQAATFFMGAWICFTVAEVLLVIGGVVESAHVVDWDKARSGCLVTRPGMFAAAGVFALTSVFLVTAVYLVALEAQKDYDIEQGIRHRVMESYNLHGSSSEPPRDSILVTMPRDFPQDNYKPSNST